MKQRLDYKFWISAALATVWAAVIFMFSAQSGDDSHVESSRIVLWLMSLLNVPQDEALINVVSFCVRKAAHMTEFALLGVLILNTLRLCASGVIGKRAYLAAFALSSAYAATDEIHQLFVPGRSGKPVDWIIDSVGIICGLIVFCLVSKFFIFVKSKRIAG